MNRPKSSKNKTKVVQNRPQKRQNDPRINDQTKDDILCKICNRVRFGQITTLPFARWRHTDCALGSEAWKMYYQLQSKTSRLSLQEFYNHVYTEAS